MSKRASLFVIAVIAGLGAAGEAFAHAELTSAMPAAGSTVTASPAAIGTGSCSASVSTRHFKS